MEYSYTQNFDNQFKNIETLKWLPWVGKNYETQPSGHKLLLVGESHYDWLEGTPNNHLENNEFTRWFINNHAVSRGKTGSKIIQGIEKAIFGGFSTPERNKNLWLSVSYYNIIQRAMKNKDDRPTLQNDFPDGWDTFFQVIDILKPDHILLCGLESSNPKNVCHFNQALSKNNFTSSGIHHLGKIGITHQKKATVENHNGYKTNLVFIKHPSAFFPWKDWTLFVRKEIPIVNSFINYTEPIHGL
jgi:hypothetical protein